MDSADHSPGMIKKGGIVWRQACAEQPKAIILPSIIGSNYFTCAILNISISFTLKKTNNKNIIPIIDPSNLVEMNYRVFFPK